MKSKNRLKFSVFVSGLIVMIPVSFVAFSLMTQFILYFQQGADPASIFHGNTLVVPLPEQATWLSWEDTAGHVPSLAQREELIAGYWLAWRAFDRAQQTGNTSDLATYWAGGAYNQIVAGVAPKFPVIVSNTGHQLELRFFSDDGSVAAIQDRGFSLVYGGSGKNTNVKVTAYAVLTLDQGFWRIRQISLHYQ